MAVTPPGWYPDPDGHVRWWDGQQWTGQVQPPPTRSPSPGAGPRRAADRSGRSRAAALVVLGALVLALVGGLAVAAVLVGRGDGAPGAAGSTGPGPAPSSPTSPTTPATPSTPSTPITPTPAPDPGPGPDEVADDFLAAALERDCVTVDRLSTAAFLRREGGCAQADLTADPEQFGYALRPASRDGDAATVEGRFSRVGTPSATSPFTFRLTLVNTARGWRVDDLVAPA